MMRYEFAARVVRTEVAGEEVGITLELIRDTDTVELHDGDEFVTLTMPTNPFVDKPRPTDLMSDD